MHKKKQFVTNSCQMIQPMNCKCLQTESWSQNNEFAILSNRKHQKHMEKHTSPNWKSTTIIVLFMTKQISYATLKHASDLLSLHTSKYIAAY